MADQDEPSARRRALHAMETFGGSSNPPPAKTTRAVLTVQSGPDAGRVVPLSSSAPNTLGRHEQCTVAFEEVRLSRIHARIQCVGGVWLLTDDGSRNGTWVNGVQVEKYCALEDGARILMAGTVSLRFTFVTADEEKALQRVYDAAMRDGLTGVYNRKALDERLSAEWAFAVRHRAPLAIVLLDIDKFKAINDQYGHLVGDHVLCEIARRLARTVRTEDVLGRFGGEEFLVVARDIDLAKGAQLAERLRRTVGEDPVVYEARALAVSASFGVATLACCGEEPQLRKLLAIADTRLYAAKHGGRNRVVAS